MTDHAVVTRSEWLEARKALLAREKGLTRLRDEISAERRALPWVRIERDYQFEAPEGSLSLADLFGGRSQLIVKHFMLAPGQKEGCVGCSFEVDHIGGALMHLEHHDVSYVAVSRAPLAEIEAFRRRMRWTFRWVSSYGSPFNYDFNASFKPKEMAQGRAFYNFRHQQVPLEDVSGRSVFYRDARGDIFLTYACFGRGAEELLGTYVALDLTPLGRNETGPSHDLSDWVRHHDRYGHPGHVAANGRWQAEDAGDGDCCQRR